MAIPKVIQRSVSAVFIVIGILLVATGTGIAERETSSGESEPCEKKTFYRDADDDGYGNPSSTAVSCDRPPGYVANADDCDDTDRSIHPGAAEVCNGIDDNCDGNVDEGVKITYYRDADDDGYGNTSSTAQACSQPPGYVANGDDCDDTERAVNPGAAEKCNGIDDDCDGKVDEGVKITYYRDADDDGYGNPSSTAQACSQPPGYVANGDDCDDTDRAVNPGAAEECNGIDDDCDGKVDEGVLITYYRDADDDEYGNASSTAQACSQPPGYVAKGGDCDDTNYAVNPGASEKCNGIDDDCDGKVDEGVLITYYRDADADGYGNPSGTAQACSQPAGYAVNGKDCDDTDREVHPGAFEVCNGVDDNCDGNVDEGVKTTYYRDSDDDGYGDSSQTARACDQPSGYVSQGGDCDDTDRNIHPGASEVCNGADDDCDGSVDEGVKTTYFRDSDGDGYGVSSQTKLSCAQPSGYAIYSGDCDDTDRDVNPGASEIYNQIDDDCDGQIDEGVGAPRTFYRDRDGDGYGDSGETTVAVAAPDGYVANDDDCDDNDKDVHPGAAETCNNIDDNCDGSVDEGLGGDYFRDGDGDGYGDPASKVVACERPQGYVANGEDCDDGDALEKPGQIWFKDEDGDRYSNGQKNTSSCERPAGYRTMSELTRTYGDCDDGNASLSPGTPELCNGKDDNCNGAVDEGAGEVYYRDGDGDGYGDPGDSTASCQEPIGYVANSDDCDDDDSEAFPGQVWYKDNDNDGYSDGVMDDSSCLRPEGYKSESELVALDSDPDDDNAEINGTAEKVRKAVVLAGGGPYEGNILWDATRLCADFAYRTLSRQGYEKENIRYLSDDNSVDSDGNGIVDDVFAPASNLQLQSALLEWAQDADSLFIYMIDHGGKGTFRMKAAEILNAEQLDAWLDTRQAGGGCEIVMVYDACQSGSFLPLLTPPAGKKRTVVASAGADEESIFVAGGTVSFSFLFWGRMINGDSFYNSFAHAKNGVGTTVGQSALIDADGDGVENEKEDKELAAKLRIGNESTAAGDVPYIGAVSAPATVVAPATATIYAEDVVDADGISQVWAVIVPPDYEHASPDEPLIDLPTVDLVSAGDAEGRYQAEIGPLTVLGTYRISIYAEDKDGEISLPRSTSVKVVAEATDSVFLYFPHAILDDGWKTEVGVVNASSTNYLLGEVTAYDAEGNIVGEPVQVVLPKRGRRWIDVGEEFDSSEIIRYLVFEGDGGEAKGYLRFALSGRYGMAAPAATRLNADRVMVSHIASDSRWTTRMALVNMSGAQKEVVIEFDTGDEAVLTIPAGGHFSSSVRDLFGGEARPDIRSAVVENAADLVGLELFRDDADNILSGILLTDELTTEMYYPHIATTDGWGTGVVAFNPDTEDCGIRIVSYSDSGEMLGTVEDVVKGGQKYVGVVSKLGLPAGAAWMAIDSDRPLTGFELFTRTNIMGGYTGVKIKKRTGCFPRLETDGATGIAFVNVGDAPVQVTLKAYDDAGRCVSTNTVEVAARAKQVGVAQSLFPDDISSATYAMFEATGDIVGFQLNMSSDNMILEGLPGL